MAVTAQTFARGLKNGFRTTWILGKVIFPITAVMTVLSYTPVIDWGVVLLKPLMGWIGLPGEAAIPLVLGNLLNLYAAIGAILSLELTVKSVFILAVMLSFSHNLPVETAIARKIGVNPWVMIGVRLGLAFLSAVIINLLWADDGEIARYGLVHHQKEELEGIWPILWFGVQKALLGIVQMAVIVIPLMVGIELLKDLQVINLLSRWMVPVTSAIGVGKNSATTLLAGLLFGIAFGAGVIIQSARENHLSKKDVYLLAIFLVACHAVVEDTLLFIPLGIPVWPLLLIRLAVAFVVTVLTARIWSHIVEQNARKGKFHAI